MCKLVDRKRGLEEMRMGEKHHMLVLCKLVDRREIGKERKERKGRERKER